MILGNDFESNIVLGESSLADNSNRALRDNNVDSNSKLLMKYGKGADCEVQQVIPESTILHSNNIIDLNKVIHILCLFTYVNTVVEFNFLIHLYTLI